MQRKYARLSRISPIGLPSGRNNLYSDIKKRMLILQNEVLKRFKKGKVKIAYEISYTFVCAQFATLF